MLREPDSVLSEAAGFLTPDVQASQAVVRGNYRNDLGPRVGEAYYNVKLIQAIRRTTGSSPTLDSAQVHAGELLLLELRHGLMNPLADSVDQEGAAKLITKLALKSTANPLENK